MAPRRKRVTRRVMATKKAAKKKATRNREQVAGAKVKAIRTDAGLTMVQFAAVCRVAPSTVTRWESRGCDHIVFLGIERAIELNG